MEHLIKTIYVVHHSHTDIGYTDLQERIIDGQANYIRTVLRMLKEKENQDFRWNCETYFCVEHFFKTASLKEKEAFFEYVRQQKIGLSATYLNFNDLMDCTVFDRRLTEMVELFKSNNITPHTAMIADINGISMGQRDVMIKHGIEFLFTNIHTHHGMYPLYQNQTPFWWENAARERMLVWNGEHYNLGNVLGIKPNRSVNFMTHNYLGSVEDFSEPVQILKENVDKYVTQCEENGYPYDFIIAGVSGVFSDNAPPNLEILRTINAYNETYSDGVRLVMVSLQELYQLIKDKIADAPVYHGDMNDWWANGVGSTPYIVKHYKEAQHFYHLCSRLDRDAFHKYPVETRMAEDNLLLYAEHTWGHSATIIDPYDTMVTNLDIRKNSYASKAHENVSLILNKIAEEKGDIRRYYNTSGRIRVKNTSSLNAVMPVEFYIENCQMRNVAIKDASCGKVIDSQLSPHPRGVLISFTDSFDKWEEKDYIYEELPENIETMNTRKAYVGSERVRDIINDYEPISYRLPYEFENKWFYLSYSQDLGITEFINKKTGKSMLKKDCVPFFTPIYESTAIKAPTIDSFGDEPGRQGEQERRLLGRNIRGKHAKHYLGKLKGIKCREHGKVFTLLELTYDLPGTMHCFVILKFYEDIAKVDFKLRIAKELCEDIESIYLSLSLELPNRTLYIKKGGEAFRPGIDQLPGSCIEYYMSDIGLVFVSDSCSALIETPDTPLITMGVLKHHPIKLCDVDARDNERDVYAWVMNNTWETNFKMDLSGYGEFKYSLNLIDGTDPVNCFNELEERSFYPYVFIME